MWQGILTKVFKVREKVAMNLGNNDEEKPFLEHLDDLRTMIVRVVITLLVAAIGTFCFYKQLFRMILFPLIWAGIASDIDHAKTILINIGAPDAFMTVVNVSLIAAVIVSFPVILIFILQFVLPGLKPNEKKMIFPGLAIATALFLVGVAFSYQMVLPRALKFFEEFGTDLGIKQTWTLESYITFSTRFILIFGVSFELPVVVMGLVKLDFLGYKTMKNTRRHAAVIIAVFSAVITPTQDIMTLLMLMVPLYVLYEICIWIAYYMEKKDRAEFPEYYAELDKDAKALETPGTDDWDNENYNPWFSDDDNKGDEDEYQRPRATPSAPPPEVETSSADTVPENLGEDQSSQVIDEDVPGEVPPPPSASLAPEEKTLEDLAREDESNSGNPGSNSNPPPPAPPFP
jgi:sec-independent protein translocase protein TatC